MSDSFGSKVVEEAKKLASTGKDPNQIANILCQQDPQGQNYGIGIILDGQGKAGATSSTLLEFAKAELESSRSATYLNSAKIMAQLTSQVLKWQRIPGEYHEKFILGLPSDAGTGAVQTAVQMGLAMKPELRTLAAEELGWPAYRAIAKGARLEVKEFPQDGILSEKETLTIYQAGPLNTTGLVRNAKTISARAAAAAKGLGFVVLDRAYSGFEFASLIGTKTYDEVLSRSFELQVKPFIESGTPFALAISPTKSFMTFALRPCGFLLVFNPGLKKEELSNTLNALIRARGSSFEHPITRAFAKAMVTNLPGLEKEHEGALTRLKESELMWRKLVKKTPLEPYFTESYAGLFRNLKIREGGDGEIYDEHLYPVLSQNRCRLNVTGIPDKEDLAKKHVAVFSTHCF